MTAIVSANRPVWQSVDWSDAAPTQAPTSNEEGDALVMLLTTAAKLSELSTTESQVKLQSAQGNLKEEMNKLLDRIKMAAEAAQQHDDDGGGFFGGLFDAVADVIGTVVGTVTDFVVDTVVVPVEATVKAAENLGNLQNMVGAVLKEAGKLVENGDVADDVKGFTKGTMDFVADATVYLAKMQTELVTSAATGQNVGESFIDDCKGLWASFKKNIVENPHVMAVIGKLAEAVAIAGAVMSGGTLGVAAAALIIALEIDRRTGVIDTVVGKDAGSWVRTGMEVGSMLCGSFAGGGAAPAKWLGKMELVSGVVSGGEAVYSGVKSIVSANDHAEQLERQADMMGTMNDIARLQQLIDSLIDEVKEKSKNHSDVIESGSQAVQTKVSGDVAVIMRA